jgi:hypothetical protein
VCESDLNAVDRKENEALFSLAVLPHHRNKIRDKPADAAAVTDVLFDSKLMRR